MEIKSKIRRVSATRTQGVEESTLGGTQLEGGKTKSEEVERVGAVGLGSYVDGWAGIDIGLRAEDD